MTNLGQHTGRPFRYRAERWIRRVVTRSIGALVLAPSRIELAPQAPSIRRILLLRVNFRLGNAVLALPAIHAVKKNFPQANIDFLGSPMSARLFHSEGLYRHYIAPRRFPRLLWEYPRLIRRLRANRYDLALDVSCSHSSAAIFILALSRARIRAGLAGPGDRVLNVKIAGLRERNKYRRMAEFLARLGLVSRGRVGGLSLSPDEEARGRERLRTMQVNSGKFVGVFVGGRKLRGKRWPLENFARVIHGIRQAGHNVVVFLGPEEQDMRTSLGAGLDPDTPIIFEPAVREFATLISQLDLFVCCDSGPMHLACALGTRVVALFRHPYVERWAPPAEIARVLVDASPDDVQSAALKELSSPFPTRAGSSSVLETIP